MKKTRISEEQMIGAVKQLEAGRAAAEIARELETVRTRVTAS